MRPQPTTDTITLPDTWIPAPVDPAMPQRRTWWRVDPGAPGCMSSIRMNVVGDAAEVSAFGMTVRCGVERAQAAVDAVLAWEQKSSEKAGQATCSRMLLAG